MRRRRFVPPGISVAVNRTDSTVDAWTCEADAVSLVQLDEVVAQPRPANIGVTHVEREYGVLAEEQESAWAAEGECTARPFQQQARGQETPATAALFLLSTDEQAVRSVQADLDHAQRVLGPEARRKLGTKWQYWIGWIILVLGDTAGVLAAAIMLGEIPWVAAGQALSSGFAATCAGLVGAELKHRQLAQARRRDPETLTEDEQRYRRFFIGGQNNLGILKLVVALSLLVVILMAVAVFALRTGAEGSAAGVAFGLFAAVTAIGSALLAYASADDVADFLTTEAKRVRDAEQHHRALAQAVEIRIHAEAKAAADSIQIEYQHRGQAAAKHVESLSWRIMRRNPQVMGHGFPSGEQTGIVGRRSRRNGSR